MNEGIEQVLEDMVYKPGCFMGVPFEEFNKEQLLKILSYSMRETEMERELHRGEMAMMRNIMEKV